MSSCWMGEENLVTVVAATAGFKVAQHCAAIERTRQALPFPSRGLLITNVPPPEDLKTPWTFFSRTWAWSGKWDRADYSRFMLRCLPRYVTTPYCIVVQWDGFAVNPQNWRDEFLDYDYIGAPWPSWMNSGRVGNGGFSLRSKAWMEFSAQPGSPSFDPVTAKNSEDYYCCHLHRRLYEKAGMKIAPVSVAMQWSLEHPVEEYPGWDVSQSFGFHGFYSPCNTQHQLPES